MTDDVPKLTALAAEITAAYVAHNPVSFDAVTGILRSVHSALRGLATPAPKPEIPLRPPVPIKKSVTPEYLISLEDGKRYQTLKRHLALRGLTPDQYRQKWGLPADYPMVAPAYSAARSQMAKSLGLGRNRQKPVKRKPTLRAVRR